MSKKVKSLIQRELGEKFKGVDSVAVINPRGIPATKNNQIRRRLRDNKLRMTVVKNTLAKRAAGDGKLKGFDALLDGPSAVIYGEASVATIARLLLDEKKNDDKIELRGIFFDGEIYTGDTGVEQVSKLPTREEAVGQVVALILAPGQRLGGIFKGQAGKVAALIKAVEERAEKSGGAAAPEAAAAPAAPTPASDAAPAT
ncbi:MAG TPA: 50S ribosomal protein L10 [Tepidisphaeraceae bacterium]|nr:50S ribosomal protein L10 [Tepidisphaeraceae bacterium]